MSEVLIKVEFNDEQKAALAAALMAVANESGELTDPTGKTSNGGETIVLSDSDDENKEDDSDCEIVGWMEEQPVLPKNLPDDFIKKEEPACENNTEIVNESEIKDEFDVTKEDVQDNIEQPSVLFQDDDQDLEDDKRLTIIENISIPLTGIIEIDNEEDEVVGVLEGDSDTEDTISADETPVEPSQEQKLNIISNVIIQGSVSEDIDNVPSTSTGIVSHLNGDIDNVPSTSTGIVSHLNGDEHSGYISMDDTSTWVDPTNLVENTLEDTDMDLEEDETINEEEDKKICELIESEDENEYYDDPKEKELPEVLKRIRPCYASLLHFFCPECNTPCGTFKRWRTHIEIYHNYRTLKSLNFRSIINKKGEICYQCKDCTEQIATSAYYSIALSHSIKHMKYPDHIKCRLCDNRYNNRTAATVHLKSKHTKICKSYFSRRKYSYGKYINIFCPVCKQSFSKPFEWRQHLNDEHDFSNKILEDYTDTHTGYFKCKTCSKSLKKYGIFQHSIIHKETPPYECNLCNNFFSNTVTTVMDHLRTKHFGLEKKKKFNCAYCDKVYDTRPKAKEHEKEVHSYGRVTCEVCGRGFKNASRLLNHMNKKNHQRLK